MPRIPLAKQQQFERDPSQPQSPEDERGPNYQNDYPGVGARLKKRATVLLR
jgi:hypothetical protein